MFIYPWCLYNGDWKEIQNVLDRWQTFNTGMIALLASIIAILAAKYQYNHDRKNNFRAIKSKLPFALSELAAYTVPAADIYATQYSINNKDDCRNFLDNNEFPAYPSHASEIVFECIKFAPTETGDELAKLLEELQIINSRLQSLKKDKKLLHIKQNDISNIKYIARFRHRVNNLFDFARSTKEFEKSNPSNDELRETIENSLNIRNIELNFPRN